MNKTRLSPDDFPAPNQRLARLMVGSAAREMLEETASEVLRHDATGTFPLAPEVMSFDARSYVCPERFERERKRIFGRIPLILAASCEIPKPGDYKTVEIAGIPVLLTRGGDGAVSALLNSCTHRGAAVAQGCGSSARFTCPYHGWTFASSGKLLAVSSAEDFGEVDRASLHMKKFPVAERAGLIWVILDHRSTADPATMLGGISSLLAGFGLDSWTFVESRSFPGPNWKLAFDAHLEFYHVPVLHRETFGPDRSNRALYFSHGPHQRLIAPRARPGTVAADDLFALGRVPGPDESINPLMIGEWIVFPGVSFNSFHPNGNRGVLMSIVLPGPNVGESVTTQTYLSETAPDDDTRSEIGNLCKFLAHVVQDEDIPTSAHQQMAIATGMVDRVRFGRNEGGLQHFHSWIERLTNVDNDELMELLADPCPST